MKPEIEELIDQHLAEYGCDPLEQDLRIGSDGEIITTWVAVCNYCSQEIAGGTGNPLTDEETTAIKEMLARWEITNITTPGRSNGKSTKMADGYSA